MESEPNRASDCLDDLTLLSLARGDLTAGSMRRAETHLEECERCRAALQILTQASADDTLVMGLDEAPAFDERVIATVSDEQLLERLASSQLATDDEVTRWRSLADEQPLLEVLRASERLTHYQIDVLMDRRQGLLGLGAYEILDEVGLGGMGIVYKARHRQMQRLVALKVLIHDAPDHAESVQRFQREIEAAGRLNHPNIASAYHAEEAEGLRFLAMEFVDGPNLSRYVRQHGPFVPTIATQLIRQAAEGLSHAHRHGVVHRDIKPSNLAVTREGVLKILDMGLARMHQSALADLEDLTQTGRVMGTVDYMAPEQAKDAKQVDERADIYSIGCSLYFLLTGKPISPDGSLAAKLLWHQVEAPPSLQEAVPDAPEVLCECFEHCVAKRPEDRPASMDAVIEQLTAAIDQLPPTPFTFIETPLTSDPGPETVGDMDHYATLLDRRTRLNVGDDTIVSMDEASKVTLPSPPTKGRSLAITATVAALLLVVAYFGIARPWQSGPDNPRPPTPAAEAESATPAWRKELETLLAKSTAVEIRLTGAEPVRSLADLPEHWQGPIESLTLEGVPQEAWTSLAAAPIHSLTVRNSPISAEAATAIGKLSELRGLTLTSVQLQDASLRPLAELPLERLAIHDSQLDDAQLAQLGSLPKLQELDLSNSLVSDRSVPALADLPALKRLVLRDTLVTSLGRTTLESRLPELEIVNDNEDADREPASGLLAIGARLRTRAKDGSERWLVGDDRLPDLPFHVLEVDARELPAAQLIDRLVELQKPKTLDLTRSDISAEAWGRIAGIKTLEKIELGPRAEPESYRDGVSLPSPTLTFSKSSDQRFASRIVEAGGEIEGVDAEGNTFEADSLESLPARGDYWLTRVDLRPAALDASKLAALRDLDQLSRLTAFAANQPQLDAIEWTVSAKTNLRELSLAGALDGQALDGFSNLESLHLDGAKISGELLERLAKLDRLQTLRLTNAKSVEGHAESWRTLAARLKRLDVRGLPLDDAWATAITSGERPVALAYLDLRETKISDASIETLRGLLSNTDVQSDPPNPDRTAARWVLMNSGRVELDSGPCVRVADLPRDGCRLIGIDAAGVSQFPVAALPELLANCRHVAWLRLSETAFDTAALSRLPATLPLLELVAADTSVDDAGLAELAKFSQLRELDLSGCSIRGATLKALPWRTLRALRLANTPLEAHRVAALASGSQLTVLDLNGARRLGDESLKALAGLRELRELGLRGVGLTDRSLPMIRGFKKLQRLELDSNNVTASGVGSLASLRELEHLSVQGTSADDGALNALAALPRLRYLNALQTNVSAQNAASVQSQRAGLMLKVSPQRPKDRRDGLN